MTVGDGTTINPGPARPAAEPWVVRIAADERCPLPDDGASLYVGQIATAGRTEVTALGDQVNEAARIEACASGGLTRASKDLMERLDEDDARALDVTPDYVTYAPLGELASASEKARRDAPAIPVCVA